MDTAQARAHERDAARQSKQRQRENASSSQGSNASRERTDRTMGRSSDTNLGALKAGKTSRAERESVDTARFASPSGKSQAGNESKKRSARKPARYDGEEEPTKKRRRAETLDSHETLSSSQGVDQMKELQAAFEARRKQEAGQQRQDSLNSRLFGTGKTTIAKPGPSARDADSNVSRKSSGVDEKTKEDSAAKRRSHNKSDYIAATLFQHSTVIRGSVSHRVLEKLGRLAPTCLVDDPYGSIESGLPVETSKGDEQAVDEEEASKPRAIELPCDSTEPDDAIPEKDGPNLKVCFRANVLPQKSKRVPKVNHRVVILHGLHRGQTGTLNG
jgi:hypothetical protein